MKILFITQKMDSNDDILGAYHGWVFKLAKKVAKINIICLQAGQYDLPANTAVYSLGKENGAARLKYLKNFFSHIWRLRQDYDIVFVHMNQEYVLLGGFFWKLWGKKIILWRNHRHGNFLTWLAVWLADSVFCTSPFSFTARFKKTKLMPVGIDTDFFSFYPASKRPASSILYVGRLAPVKRIEVLLSAVSLLKKEAIDFNLVIYGAAESKDKKYFEDLKTMAGQKDLPAGIWRGSAPNVKMPQIYSANEIVVNLTPAGSLDKIIIEAMACGCLVLFSNKAFNGQIDDIFIFKEENPIDLAQKIKNIMALSAGEKINYQKKLREYIIRNHSLDKLVDKLSEEFKNL